MATAGSIIDQNPATDWQIYPSIPNTLESTMPYNNTYSAGNGIDFNQIGGYIQDTGNAISGFSTLLGPQTKTGAVLSAIGKQASNIPVVGSIANGALQTVGALANGFAGAKVDMSTGDVTKGGIFKDSPRAKRIGRSIKTGLQDNAYSYQNTADINADWNEQNYGTKTGVLSVANGGKVPVYLDNNESYTTPFGYGGIVPNTGNGTDTHLYNLPEGSKVYSDDLKDNNGVSFSKKAKPYLKAINNSANDIYSQNTKKLSQQELNDIYQEQEYMKSIKGIKNNKYKTVKTAKYGDWITGIGNIGSQLGILAPILSNLSAKAETTPFYTNPNASASKNLMGNLYYDINPMLKQNQRNYQTANYNVNQLNTNTGANMAERVSNYYNKQQQDYNMYSDKNNRDNAYKQNYANFLYQSGNDWLNGIRDWTNTNTQNRAAARNIRQTGLTQLSQYLQNQQLMNNQKARDKAITPVMMEYLKGILPTNSLDNLINLYYK